MAETIYKSGRRKGFTVVFRSVAQDKRLSLKARGLFLLLQSLPDDWKYTGAGLAAAAGAGKDQIRSALDELIAVGYLAKEQAHDEGGKFAGNIFVLQEEAPPLTGNPSTVFPSTEKPSTENPPVNNNNINNIPPIVPQRGDELEAMFERFYAAYPRHVGRAAALRAWMRLKPAADLIGRMETALNAQKQSESWQRDNGRYIPYPATWLNQRRWEDELETAQPNREAGDEDGI